jgi:hypothetical protein
MDDSVLASGLFATAFALQAQAELCLLGHRFSFFESWRSGALAIGRQLVVFERDFLRACRLRSWLPCCAFRSAALPRGCGRVRGRLCRILVLHDFRDSLWRDFHDLSLEVFEFEAFLL